MNVRVISVWHSLALRVIVHRNFHMALFVIVHRNFLMSNRHTSWSRMRSVGWSGDSVDGPWSRRIKISYALFCHSVTDAFLSRQPEHQLKQTTPKFPSAYTSTRLTESFARNWVSQFLKSIYSNVSFTENYRNDSNKCPQITVATDRDKTYHKIDSHIPHSWPACAALLQD